jgi:hypothetical protein
MWGTQCTSKKALQTLDDWIVLHWCHTGQPLAASAHGLCGCATPLADVVLWRMRVQRLLGVVQLCDCGSATLWVWREGCYKCGCKVPNAKSLAGRSSSQAQHHCLAHGWPFFCACLWCLSLECPFFECQSLGWRRGPQHCLALH